jgi:regulator of cell morphogenesis and NO signaling
MNKGTQMMKLSTTSIWYNRPLSELVNHLKQMHQYYYKEKIPQIHQLLVETMDIHGEKHGSTIKCLLDLFVSFKAEKEIHFKKEEQVLFSYIFQLENYKQNGGVKPTIQFHSIENPISQIEYDHEKLEHGILDKMREVTSDYLLPSDASDVFSELYRNLKDLESELKEHMFLETEILFPKAIELELSILHRK